MFLQLTQATHIENYKLALSFSNGREGVADLSEIVLQGVFQSIAPVEIFSLARLDEELRTVTWPGGLDLATEYLYYQAFKNETNEQEQFKQWGYVA